MSINYGALLKLEDKELKELTEILVDNLDKNGVPCRTELQKLVKETVVIEQGYRLGKTKPDRSYTQQTMTISWFIG